MSLMSLPTEIRLQIYNYALTPSRLCTRAILDPEWLFASDRGCQLAPLLFVSKQIYFESAPIFYAKATLEVTACQRDPTDGRHLSEFLKQYEQDYSFCPTHLLRAITSVHVYGDQAWPVDQDSFQALFRWLISHTGVRHIYLSRKTMQQGRHIPELISLDNLAYDMSKQTHDNRIVDIYARNISSRLRMRTPGKSNQPHRATPRPDVQIYLDMSLNDAPLLYREPQRNLRLVDGGIACTEDELFKQQQERFANGTLGDAYLRQAHSEGYLWLYKTIQIQRRSRCSAPIGPTTFNMNSILAF